MDGVYLELAEQFNQQRQTLSNGKKAAIAVRKLDSGLGADNLKRYEETPVLEKILLSDGSIQPAGWKVVTFGH